MAALVDSIKGSLGLGDTSIRQLLTQAINLGALVAQYEFSNVRDLPSTHAPSITQL